MHKFQLKRRLGQKRYLVYHPADIFTYSFLVLPIICACVWMIIRGYDFMYGPLVILSIAVFYTFLYYTRMVSFDDAAIHYQSFFKKRTILWTDICCYGRFLRQSPNYKRWYIYFSTEPLKDTCFLRGVDMPKVSNTLFLVAYRPAIETIMKEHGLRNM